MRPILRASAVAALLALAPGCCAAGPGRAAARGVAEYDGHVADLLADAPPGFTAVAVPPFVVVGDGAPRDVRADAAEIVAWAVARLKADYFPLDPSPIVDIWIFDGEASYRHHVNVLFGGLPPSPYGYYSPCDDAIAVDITLGGGTVVHEMVHAFVEANFPDCPTWFDEGLASLYEHTEDDAGHIRGRINWRLPRLQEAIRSGAAPRIDELVATSRGEFYDGQAASYAAARYLLYYLQERGVLRRYYHRFRETRESDPTGLAALQSVLGERDVRAIQAQWVAFVAHLPGP